ncbi:hypothetical protein ACTFIU_004957 [Dictyostelium citrinum]
MGITRLSKFSNWNYNIIRRTREFITALIYLHLQMNYYHQMVVILTKLSKFSNWSSKEKLLKRILYFKFKWLEVYLLYMVTKSITSTTTTNSNNLAPSLNELSSSNINNS